MSDQLDGGVLDAHGLAERGGIVQHILRVGTRGYGQMSGQQGNARLEGPHVQVLHSRHARHLQALLHASNLLQGPLE